MNRTEFLSCSPLLPLLVFFRCFLRCFFLPVLLGPALLLSAMPALGDGTEAPVERLLEAHLKSRTGAEDVTVVLEGGDARIRKGYAPKLYLCLTGIRMEGTRIDKLLVNLEGVRYVPDGKGLRIDSFEKALVTGSLLVEDFARSVAASFPNLKEPEVVLEGGKVTVKGVYSREGGLVKLRSLMRFTGSYRIDPATGTAHYEITEATGDNALVSKADVAKALSSRSPKISLSSFFVKQRIREIRVDKGMLWFSSGSGVPY